MAKDIDLKEDTQTELNIDTPKMYKVIMLNDDYTTMDFVVDVLMQIFHKTYEEAVDIMITIHKAGQGLCGLYSYEIAEAKVVQVKKMARKNSFPLRVIMEEE